MEKIFVLKRDKFMKGPYTLNELKIKGLKGSDKVWYEGMTDWAFAGNIAEFQDLIRSKSVETITSSSFLSRLFKI